MTKPDIDHVVCTVCDPATYLCGTHRDFENERFAWFGEEHEGDPCVLCFAAATLPCQWCGTTIRTRVPRYSPPRPLWRRLIEAWRGAPS